MRTVVLVALAVALLATGVLAAYLMFLEDAPGGPARTLRAFPLHLLLLSLAASVVLVLALRSQTDGGRAVVAVTASLAGLLAGVTALVPTAAQLRAASEMDAPVSFGEYLLHSVTPNSGEPRPNRGVTYAEVDGHALRLDVWQARATADGPDRRPAVVLLHGGAWRSGHRGSTPDWNRWLTEQGYHVFDADYRLVGQVPEGTAWRSTVRDAACAVAWVAAHADRFGVDPERITVMGRSAGAHLAMMVGYTSTAAEPDPRFRPSCPLPLPRVRSVVELFGRADLTQFDGGDHATARDTLAALTGGTPASHPERYAAASPVSHVTPEAPPTLMLAGESDHLVPPEQARALAGVLDANGVPHQARYFPYADHDFDRNWGGIPTQASRTAIHAFLARYG
ncbi:alpha/beta hydrolase fold domain-containing protein [Streptomyces sp. 4N509B]|uniref:alpha/beta hydrolase fold domain-containing protein n=1 Tax=Streptomyces sp. 4N509B TaxID=3457413 RepID=UPI003FD4B8E4